MFGSYRKDDANDPDIYAAAVGLALSDYPRSVVEYATDPRTGLAAKHKFPPNVAEVKEFCDDEMARIERMSRPAPRFVKRGYEPPPHYPGRRANVLVGPASPMYALAEGYTRSPNADVLNWRPDKEGRGIWLAWNVYDDLRFERRRIESWRSPSDADLRAIYGKQEAEHG